ncbi:hypothetical protein PAEPH01_2700, partial [Pancytospora epiphaga]
AKYLGREKGAYSGWYNNLDQYITAITVIVLNMSSFSNLTQTTSWFTVAILTPIVACISTVCILGIATYNAATEDATVGWINSLFSGYKMMIKAENYLGMICMAAMKIFKFTAFDVTKEKISMRIEGRYRPKFKSVFDGIFNKGGKSFGAFYGILINVFSSNIDIRGMSPITSVFSILFIFCWGLSVLYLSGSYERSLSSKSNVDIDLVESEAEDEQEEQNEIEKEKEEIIRRRQLKAIQNK